jgi:ribonuclease P protein component
VLPPAHRLRRAADFTAVTRRGRRLRSGSVVVYLLTEPPGGTSRTSRVGLVVGKAVGSSVVRHQVSRRLRAQLRPRLDRLPAGASLVVRALPESAASSSAALGHDLDRALAKLTGPRAGTNPRARTAQSGASSPAGATDAPSGPRSGSDR